MVPSVPPLPFSPFPFCAKKYQKCATMEGIYTASDVINESTVFCCSKYANVYYLSPRILSCETPTVVSLLTTSMECNDISMFTSTEKYLQCNDNTASNINCA